MKNLNELSETEMRSIQGGDTSFAYDVGTFFRIALNSHNAAKACMIAGFWAAQQ